jgi:hypothetical protein
MFNSLNTWEAFQKESFERRDLILNITLSIDQIYASGIP